MIWDDLKTLIKYMKEVMAKLSLLEADHAHADDKMESLAFDIRRMIVSVQEDNATILYKLSQQRVEILERLDKIEQALIPAEAARIVFIQVLDDGITLEVSSMQMSVEKVCMLKIAPVDKFGNPAKVDGAPAWSLTDPALGALEVDADGMGAKFTPAGAIGSVSVQVNADADLGDGVKTLAGELPLELLAGEAVAVNVSGTVV